jgi:glucuronokinase
VGLGSSSALVIAVLRALCEAHELELEPAEMAELALAIEVEELGIAAGLQDRVVQAYGGLVFMDFGEHAAPRRYEPLNAELLPPLVVAWREDAAASSATVHGGLRQRHDRERGVRVAMAELGDAAREARDALAARDTNRFARAVDATFDLRERIVELDPQCVEMVLAARRAGAAANYTGSGGAIVAVCRDERHAGEVTVALRRTGCAVAQYEYA